jgi:hypothetical protein
MKMPPTGLGTAGGNSINAACGPARGRVGPTIRPDCDVGVNRQRVPVIGTDEPRFVYIDQRQIRIKSWLTGYHSAGITVCGWRLDAGRDPFCCASPDCRVDVGCKIEPR